MVRKIKKENSSCITDELCLLCRWERQGVGERGVKSTGGDKRKEMLGGGNETVREAKEGLTIILAALTKMADRCCPPSSVVGQPEFRTQTL